MFKYASFLALLLLFTLFSSVYTAEINYPSDEQFKTFINQLKQDLKKDYKFSDKFLDEVFKNVKFIKPAITKDKKQAEFSDSFYSYINRAITTARIENGYKALEENKDYLATAYDKYGLFPDVLVAFAGVETRYGKITGGFDTISTLSTLIYEGRRKAFFTKELASLLKLIEKKYINPNVKSSWAGALGIPQFLPSTYEYYAVDANLDGKKELFVFGHDLFASMGNFLQKLGYKKYEPWGMEVSVPANFDFKLAARNIRKPLKEWKELGIKAISDKDLPLESETNDYSSAIIAPTGANGPIFIVFNNFYVFLKWNNSINYALSVGILSDILANRINAISIVPIPDYPIPNKKTIESVKKSLIKKGFFTETMKDSQLKDAIIDYQRANNLISDGYLSPKIVESITK